MNSTPETKTTVAREARKKELIAAVVAKNFLINDATLPREIYTNANGTNPSDFNDEDRDIVKASEIILQEHAAKSPATWTAFAQINENDRFKLAGYSSFEKYCEEKWHIRRSHGYRFLAAAKVLKYLSPIGDRCPLPVVESQVRPLAGLPPHAVETIWQSLADEAGAGRITAKAVSAKVSQFKLAHGVTTNTSQPPKQPVKIGVDMFRSMLRMTHFVGRNIANENYELALECLGSIQNQLSQIEISGCRVCQADQYPPPEYHI